MRTYSDGKRVYSVDMLIAYIILHKIRAKTVQLISLGHYLTAEMWTDDKGRSVSAADIVQNPKLSSYHTNAIKNADLKYPILISNNNVIDGVHRIAKSYLKNIKTIKVQEIPADIMRKCQIGTTNKWAAIDKLNCFDMIVLYNKKFGPVAKSRAKPKPKPKV